MDATAWGWSIIVQHLRRLPTWMACRAVSIRMSWRRHWARGAGCRGRMHLDTGWCEEHLSHAVELGGVGGAEGRGVGGVPAIGPALRPNTHEAAAVLVGGVARIVDTPLAAGSARGWASADRLLPSLRAGSAWRKGNSPLARGAGRQNREKTLMAPSESRRIACSKSGTRREAGALAGPS